MTQTKLQYRAEIDGLRALAVISVILYHAKFLIFGTDWFDGGYIGVDIFFVISGYLITRIILLELQQEDSFSFFNFYRRRARRILPMLFLVILATAPFAWQKLLPTDFVEYAQSILASIFFSSNFFFYFSTTEYGADSALLKPFLHTWSLGVEEQFYLFFPILSVIVFKYARFYFIGMLVLLSLISLLFSHWMETHNPDLNFYLPFSRFWELAVGSILAYRELNQRLTKNNFLNHALPALGLGLLIYSILAFDGETPHPSLETILPILGVALIIVFSSDQDLTGKLLGCKSFVAIGLISYSAYLWHFPIFAFARLGDDEHTNYDKFEWILLTVLLSILSYFLVEKPFRRRLQSKMFVGLCALSIMLIIAGAVYVIQTDGVPTQARLGFNENLIDTVARPDKFFDNQGLHSCGDNNVNINGSVWCTLGKTDKSAFDFIVIGDSHSRTSTHLLNRLGRENNQKGLYFGTSGCLPLIGIYPVRGGAHPSQQSLDCQGRTITAYKFAKDFNIKNVILIARWDYYVDGKDTNDWNRITDRSFQILGKRQSRQLYLQAAQQTVELYETIPARLVVMLQVPHQTLHPKRVLEGLLDQSDVEQRLSYLQASKEKFLSLPMHQDRQTLASHPWRTLSKTTATDDLLVLDPTDEFCDGSVCPIYDSRSFFYFDDDHASTNGFERLEQLFTEMFK